MSAVADPVPEHDCYEDDFEPDELDGGAIGLPAPPKDTRASAVPATTMGKAPVIDPTPLPNPPSQDEPAPASSPASALVAEPAPESAPVPTAASLATQISEPAAAARAAVEAPWGVVTLADLQMGEMLGAGGMGTVHAAAWNGRAVAVKTLRDTSAEALAAIETELMVHAGLHHGGIVQLLGANLERASSSGASGSAGAPFCCIVLEHCATSLWHRLHRQREEVERRWVVDISLQVAEAMEYLHAQSPAVVHRDLKSQNVLIHHDGSAKLCDFGLVDVKEVTAGTPNYMAPELLQAKPYSKAVDVYAFGVLLNEAFVREVPWDGYRPYDIKEQVVAGKRPPTAMTMPMAAERLLQAAWHQSAALRPTFAEVVRGLRTVLEDLPLGAAALGLGSLEDMPDALDAIL